MIAPILARAVRRVSSFTAFVLPALLALSAVVPQAAAAEPPLVAAASDLRFALDEVAAQFARGTGHTLRIVYGSSGNFRRQIAEGAPFELFLSADEGYIAALRAERRVVDDGVLYATGRLALVVPAESKLNLDPTLLDVAAAARDGRVRKFAIANPEHAPYGRAAQQALVKAGAWEQLAGRLVLGENVSQAAQFATSGSAEGGLVALSLALAPGALGSARYVAIPESMHQPLRQRMALTARAGPIARAFYEYLQQPAARRVLARYGFSLPGE